MKISNTKINYRLLGQGKLTLLFVHGSFIDQTYWQKQISFFEPDYQVLTLDLAGHGLSGHDGHDWSARRLAADVEALIVELDLQSIILIGHSFGAVITLLTAIQLPERIIGLISVDYFKNAATPPRAEMEAQKAGILTSMEKDFAGTNEQYARTALLTQATPPVITERVVQAYRNAYEPMGKINIAEIFEIYQTEAELLPKLRVKLYLINVDYQPTNVAALHQHLVNGFELVEIHGTSHFPMLEEPEKLNEVLGSVIRKITGS